MKRQIAMEGLRIRSLSIMNKAFPGKWALEVYVMLYWFVIMVIIAKHRLDSRGWKSDRISQNCSTILGKWISKVLELL